MRFIVCLVALLGLAACAGQSVWAPDADVAQARYVHPGPTEITLVTSLADRSGEGAHSAILINASQRVLFDPAGNWDQPAAPERNDVRFGMTPGMERNYIAFQAGPNYHAVVQRITVSPEVAEQALQLALANGAVAPAFCAQATSTLLGRLPGFEGVRSGMFPKSVMDSFADLPGVRTEVHFGAGETELTSAARRVLARVAPAEAF